MRKTGLTALLLVACVAAIGEAPSGFDAEAIRLNNRGAALMGQQSTERAAASFALAFKKDPKFAQAAVNEGIALFALQKVDEAKAAFKQAIALDPTNPQVWYNLGLAQHAGNELEAALTSFQQVVKLDPRDADSLYFEGACYQELKEFDQAVTAFEAALSVSPLHASAQFGLARAWQRTGHTAEAKEHFARFQHLTNTKISSAIGLSYGEQGHYSLVTAVEARLTIQPAMIPVRLVAEPQVSAGPAASAFTTTGGATWSALYGTVTNAGSIIAYRDGIRARNWIFIVRPMQARYWPNAAFRCSVWSQVVCSASATKYRR